MTVTTTYRLDRMRDVELLAACGDGETPNTQANSQLTEENRQNAPEDSTENTKSLYVNHPLTASLYGEWELEENDFYDQGEKIPCSVLTINEDGTCIADGTAGSWVFSDKTKDDFLRIDILINGEYKLCVALYGTTNTIAVWSAGYDSFVDTSWVNKSAQEQ